MKFRLDTQHYINDRLLEPGHIIGDETDVPFVNADGSPMKPSVNMTPVDDEARSLFRDTFPGSRLPDRDPTAKIPLRGTGDSAKAPPLYTKDSEGRVVQPGNPPTTEDPVPADKKGLNDAHSPNHPVGQPVTGTVSTPPVVPSKPEDPALRVATPQAEAKAVADAQAKARADAAKGK